MSKRASDGHDVSDVPVPKKAPSPVQSTLDMFFKGIPNSDTCTTTKVTTVDFTPEYLGIHVFSHDDITESTGLDKNSGMLKQLNYAKIKL